MAKETPTNRLLFGDSLKWLRDAKVFPDASVDLVYLDPPPPRARSAPVVLCRWLRHSRGPRESAATITLADVTVRTKRL